MLKYELLNFEQLAYIANGCGPKSSWAKVPDFVFKETCDRHDVDYWVGGTKQDRKKYDDAFYYRMLNDASKFGWKRYFYRITALIYYYAVRFEGDDYFYFGEKRGFKELEEEMANG